MQTNSLTDTKSKVISWINQCKRDQAYWNSKFSRFSRWASRITGRPLAFNLAIAVILIWVVSGPIFGFSDTWQLIINTATTIVTFLMVFLIQHTQNKDTEAIQMKLDEIIRAMNGAHNAVLDLEELEEHELELFKTSYLSLAKLARQNLKNGLPDTDTPDIET